MEETKLRSVPLFSGLSRKELQRLSSVTDEIVLPSGTRLISEGAFSHEFLLITSGSAEVRHHNRLVAELGPGDFAGEVGVMRDARRNANVVAKTELTAIVMTDRDLRRIAQELPSVASQIEAAIAARSDTDSYARPMLTVDVVALTVSAVPSVLLIQRDHDPFVGQWALPGGFVEDREQVAEAAPRELAEETGLHVHSRSLELLGVYDTPNRDPRGWSVSVVYLARVSREQAVTGSDDARDARWFHPDALPELAFDHAIIVADALRIQAERRA
jgi:8-oxo-dGTP diphosphatase